MTRRIEPMSWAAAGPISELHRACFPEDPWDVGAITQIMGMPGFFGRIGWEEGGPVGFALALDLRKETEILSLGVLRDYRRTGIGSALLNAVCLEAQVRAAECVVLEVAVDNAAARALYAVCGFTAVGHRPNYYRNVGSLADGLILRRTLAAAPPAT
jgi:[ribosomal protein S18]-alanine N-acetyltransferase